MFKQIEFKKDINGNKCISVKFEGFRAFSIQTLGNLPIAHTTSFNAFEDIDYKVLETLNAEILEYLTNYGTKAQKKAAGLM